VDAAPVAPVERRIAGDLARKGILAAPLVVLVAGLARGAGGAGSAALALAFLVANFFVSALSLEWAARRGPGTLGAVALGGFLVRMGVLVGVTLSASALFEWVDLPMFAITLFLGQVGLLLWELRSVSFSLALPETGHDGAAGKELAP
jgi:hypothetical protein